MSTICSMPSSTGSSFGGLLIGGLPFVSNNNSGRIWTTPISQFYNSSLSLAGASDNDLTGFIYPGVFHIGVGQVTQPIPAPLFYGSGFISLSGFYETNE